MLRERLLSIWSLKHRTETVVRIAYRVHDTGRCRILTIERLDHLDP